MSSSSASPSEAPRVLHVRHTFLGTPSDLAWHIGRSFRAPHYARLDLALVHAGPQTAAAAAAPTCLGLDDRAVDARRPRAARAAVSRVTAGRHFALTLVHRFRVARLVDAAMTQEARGVGLFVVHGRGVLRSATRRRRMRKMLDAGWVAVAVSAFVAEDLLSAGVREERVAVVPNALDLAGLRARALSRAAARERLGLPSDALVVGAVGRLVPKKGADLLVDAAARVEAPDLRFVWLGAGRERAALQRRVEATGLAHRFAFPGHVPDAARLLRAFDLVVQPSRDEAFGLAALEAMALGVPVLASDGGGLVELIDDPAHRFAAEDVDALVALLDRAVASGAESRTAYGHRLRVRADTHFDLPVMQAAYRRLAAGLVRTS